MSLRRFLIALLASTAVMAADSAPGCVAIEGERILAGDLARALPAFSAIAPEIELGYAPVPGVRRFFTLPSCAGWRCATTSRFRWMPKLASSA